MTLRQNDMAEFRNWLLRNGYQDAFPLLWTSLSSFGSRLSLLERDLKTVKSLLLEFDKEQELAKSDSARHESIGQDKRLHEVAQHLYYATLESVSRLMVMTEILLAYYGALRMDARRLPRILTEIRPVTFSAEAHRIGKLRLSKVYSDFKFPNVSGFSCSQEEKRLLRLVLRRTASSLRRNLQDLVKFRERFLVVYNKYKHSLVEIVDRYVTASSNGGVVCIPQLYVRSSENSNRSGRQKVYTYAVRVDARLVDYMDRMIKTFATVTVSLLDGHFQWIANRGKAHFPRRFDANPDETEKMKGPISTEPDLRYVVDFRPEFHVTWKPLLVTRAERQLQRAHIARLGIDMMDPHKLKILNLRRIEEQPSETQTTP